MILRAPIFLVATWHRGLEAISIAVVVEAAYSAAISGCYGAFVEKLRNAQPLWISGLLILVVLPAILLWFDYLLHWFTGNAQFARRHGQRRHSLAAFLAV